MQFSTARSVQFSVAGNNPRPHGEASCRGLDLWDDQGLSPPTRGSRQAGRAGDGRQGSIPAHTGKPTAGRQVEGESRVYPRPHGEAVHLDRRAHVGPGLSPPTRGSRVGSVARVVRLGSIPAHTGKPRAHRGCRRGRGVYPRPHGEASRSSARPCRPLQVYPRPHGEAASGAGPPYDDVGSIPAHTGKPSAETEA